MARLCDLSCKACRGDMPALKGDALADCARQVPQWEVIDEHHLSRTFRFPDFAGAMEFVCRVAELAEAEQHHPNIHVSWGN